MGEWYRSNGSQCTKLIGIPSLSSQSKQSLSEVENLYYKHRRASGSRPSPNALSSQSPQTYRSGSVGIGSGQKYHYPPSTPTPQGRTKTSPTAQRKPSIGGGSGMANNPNNNMTTDVFAGLVTPPASGGTLPGVYDRYKDLFSSNYSFASGLNAQKSPSLNASNGRNGSQQSANKSGKSYADFWSKIGSSNVTSTTGKP